MPNAFDQNNFQEQQANFLNQQEAFQNQQRWGWPCPPCPPCRCDCRQCWGWGNNWNRPWDGRNPGQGNQPPRR